MNRLLFRYGVMALMTALLVPQAPAQRTVVNVTILNERGEKVYSDSDENAGEGLSWG